MIGSAPTVLPQVPAWYAKNKLTNNAIGAVIQAASSGRVLLGCRSQSSDSPFTWCNFGGGIEDGESPLEALAREFVEEIGVTLDTSAAMPIAVFRSPRKDFAFFTLHLTVPDEFIVTLNKEHVGWTWASMGSLPQPLHPGFQDMLRLPAVLHHLTSKEL